jgi:hypothetical protein
VDDSDPVLRSWHSILADRSPPTPPRDKLGSAGRLQKLHHSCGGCDELCFADSPLDRGESLVNEGVRVTHDEESDEHDAEPRQLHEKTEVHEHVPNIDVGGGV